MATPSQTNYAPSNLSAEDAFAITPSDTVNFANVVRGIYIGVSGDVVAVTPAGNVLTFKNAQSGSVLPVRASRINSTLTTATNLIGLL